MSFSLSQKLSSVPLERARELMEKAFATWQAARCPPDGLPPSIELVEPFGTAQCKRAEYNPDAPNANIIMFEEKAWPYSGEGQSLAVTSVVSHRMTGEIYDADIQLNATLELLTEAVSDKGIIVGAGSYDLLSILTHEAGHFLGLAHSQEPEAIMRVALDPEEIATELSEDDVAAICAAYPPDRAVESCDPEPRNGFSSQCARRPAKAACNVSAARPAEAPFLTCWLIAGCAAALAWRGRSRRS